MSTVKSGRGLGARRARVIAAIWLALCALVFLRTEPDEYAWDFNEFTYRLIWETEAEAAARQAEADAHMAARRAEAAARAEAGVWGVNEEQYDGKPGMQAAQIDGEPGLNLMWGTYRLLVEYESAEPIALRVVSPGRQAFVRGGAYALEPSAQGRLETSFELTGTSLSVMLAGDLPENAVLRKINIQKAGTGVFSPDLAAYAALAGCLLTFLYALTWDTSERGRLRRRDAMILLLAAVFASLPSLWYGLMYGHDLYFHLNRIEGVAAGLRAGEFPVRIHSSTLLGYGYAAPEFYPELFLYFPALLRNLGVSLTVCVGLYQMLVNLAATAAAYACGRRLFGERRVALGAAVLYALSVDRVVNLYVRGSLGESMAMVFFPVIVMAMADVLLGDERRWPLLALGAYGVFMSHMLSTLFVAGACVLAVLPCARRLLREPRRILAILKAAGLTALCSLWFLIPFLSYSLAGINVNLMASSWKNALSLGSLLVAFAGNVAGIPEAEEDFSYHVGTVPGVALLAGCALLLVRLYARGGLSRARAELDGGEGREKLAAALLALGAALLLASTTLVPWKRLCLMRRPISGIAQQIQFPWRLVGVATPLLAMAAAYGYVGRERFAAAGMAALCALSVVMGGYTLTAYPQGKEAYAPDFCCDTRIGQFEYIYLYTEKGALEAGRFTAEGEPVVPVAYEREGTSLYARFDGDARAYYELPMLYYPGYRASVNGVECSVGRGVNNVLRVENPQGGQGVELRVWYAEPAIWRAAEAASAAGLLLLAALLAGTRRRMRAA